MLARCHALEERAGALYRSWAARARNDPAACALWTALAREEEEHARTLATAARHVHALRSGVRIDGWEDALIDVQDRLASGEALGAGTGLDRALAAALDLEMTELDALRHVLLALSHEPGGGGDPSTHASRLAEAATALSEDPHVRLQAALLLARARLRERER